MFRFVTKAVLLVLVLLVAVPSIQAAGPEENVRFSESGSTSLVSWGFLGDLWNVFVGAWANNGCELDPDGRCAPRHSKANADNGCEVDPSGGCGR